MSGIFLFEPITHNAILNQLNAENPEAAILPDCRLVSSPQGWMPGLAATPGGDVQGVYLRAPDPQTCARLDFLMTGFGCTAQSRGVRIGGETREAQVYSADVTGDRPWDGGVPAEVLADAIAEALEHFGRFSGDALAQRMAMIMARANARQAARAGAPAAIRSDQNRDAIDVSETHIRHVGFFMTREHHLRHPNFAGGMSAPVKREVFVATDAAIVLPYDARRDRVLLVEQFRMGPFGRGDPRPWMLEPVAGRVDAGETPEATARRECLEEAGLELRGLEKIAAYYCSPGCSTEYFHCFLGLCDLPDAGRGSGGLATEHEDIRTHVLDYQTAMGLVASGEADNGPLILSLIWLQRERARLRSGA